MPVIAAFAYKYPSWYSGADIEFKLLWVLPAVVPFLILFALWIKNTTVSVVVAGLLGLLELFAYVCMIIIILLGGIGAPFNIVSETTDIDNYLDFDKGVYEDLLPDEENRETVLDFLPSKDELKNLNNPEYIYRYRKNFCHVEVSADYDSDEYNIIKEKYSHEFEKAYYYEGPGTEYFSEPVSGINLCVRFEDLQRITYEFEWLLID